ncbi:MAG: hypothetical protein WD136_07405 [Cyanobium sp.]
MALGTIDWVSVPDATIEGYLAPIPGEQAFISRLIEQGEAQAHRVLVAAELNPSITRPGRRHASAAGQILRKRGLFR